MKRFAVLVTVLVTTVSPAVAQNPSKDTSIKKDIAERDGVWQVVELVVNGDRATANDMKQITVTNVGNVWIVTQDGREVARGTSTIDPAAKPKTIDFTLSDAAMKGQVFRGIYEITGNSRRLCYAPAGIDRPTAFVSSPGSDFVLLVLQRVK